MLKLMRDSFQHLKWILVAVVAVFILFIFVDWGGSGPTGRANPTGYAAKVNGQTISMQEYSRALFMMTRNYEQMYRQPLSPEMIEAMGLSRQTIDSLVDQRLMLQEAARLQILGAPNFSFWNGAGMKAYLLQSIYQLHILPPAYLEGLSFTLQASDARSAFLFCPPSITVHDNGDVFG